MSNYPTPDQPSLTDGVNPPCEHGVDRSYFVCPVCDASLSHVDAPIVIEYTDGETVTLPSLNEIIAQQKAAISWAESQGLLNDDDDVEDDAEGIDWHETRLS